MFAISRPSLCWFDQDYCLWFWFCLRCVVFKDGLGPYVGGSNPHTHCTLVNCLQLFMDCYFLCMSQRSIHQFVMLTLKVLNFWKFTSYCSLKPLWSGMGEVVPACTSPTLYAPIPSHCASIVVTSTLRVKLLLDNLRHVTSTWSLMCKAR